MTAVEFIESKIKKNTNWKFEDNDEKYTLISLINDIKVSKIIHKQQIKDAYNQGFRDGLQDYKTCGKVCAMDLDVEEHSNADDYYNDLYKEKL